MLWRKRAPVDVPTISRFTSGGSRSHSTVPHVHLGMRDEEGMIVIVIVIAILTVIVVLIVIVIVIVIVI